MKKIAVLLYSVIFLTLLPQAYAEQTQTMVIIDDYLNVENLLVKDKVVQELCILETSKCNNGENFDAGLGSANRSANHSKVTHGTQMLQVANKINPNLNFIFISTGERAESGEELGIAESSITESLKWAYENKDLYNIVVVSGSFGLHDLDPNAPACTSVPELSESVQKLKSVGIASVFAAGNGEDYKKIDYPACLKDAIGIGATSKSNKIELYGNYSNDIDFFALGTYKINNKNIVGTSASTAGFSAFWAKNYMGNYNDTYNKIKLLRKKVSSESMIIVSTNFKVKTIKLTATKFVDILKQ